MEPRDRDERLHITYATTFDPSDIRAWSGTIYHLAKALEKAEMQVDYCGEIAKNQVLVNKAINKITKLSSLGELFPVERTNRMAKLFAERIRAHLMRSRCDIVFSPGSIPLALLKTKRPKVFYTDATFAGILEQYPEFSDYPKRYIKEGHDLEQQALDNCDLAIYSSQWAARTAMEHYGMDADRIRVVPFGSNLRTTPDASEVSDHIHARANTPCELLFIGVAWERKGGPKVLEIARELHARGIPVRVHVVGSAPPDSDLPDYVITHGFVSKETEEGRQKLAQLLARAHFLLLPSLAECMGIVLCEANAYGVPCLANDVGGIPEVVKNDINGRLFQVDAPAGEWAAHIAGLYEDGQRYRALAITSRKEFDQRLNWDTTGAAIRGYLQELV